MRIFVLISDDATGFGFIALSYILSSVSGEIVDLHIIWALCYVSTSRLTTLPAVCQNRYLLDEHSSWCMLFLDLKLNITIDTPRQTWSLLISDMKPTINSLELVECGCLPKVILFYTCSKFCNYTLSVVYSMDIFVLHYMDLRFALSEPYIMCLALCLSFAEIDTF